MAAPVGSSAAEKRLLSLTSTQELEGNIKIEAKKAGSNLDELLHPRGKRSRCSPTEMPTHAAVSLSFKL